MPYTQAQCRLFAAKAARGGAVPSDWKRHCQKPKKASRKKTRRK